MSIMSRTPLIKTDDLEVNNKATFKKQGILNEGATRLLGPITASTYLNVSGNTVFEADVNIKKNLTVEGLFISSNNSSTSNSGVGTDNLIVSKTSTLNGAVTAVSSLNVSGSTTLLGAVTAVSSLNVSGNTTLLGAVTAVSSLNVSGNTTLLGAVTAVSSLNVSGKTTLNGAVTAISSLNILGNITTNSNINISGNATIEGYIYSENLDSILSGGTLNIGSSKASNINLGNGSAIQTVNIGTNGGGITTINIGGTGDIVNIAGSVNNIQSTNLQVTDKLILLNKDSLGSGTARGSGFQIRDSNDNNKSYFIINQTGTGFLLKPPEDTREINFETKNFVDGLLKISGNTIFGSSTLDTELLFNSNVTMMSKLNISGNTILQGPITGISTLNISGNTILQGPTTALSSVDVIGNSTVKANLNISGNSTFNGPITGISTLNISGNTILQGPTTALSSLDIIGNSTIKGNLNISGSTTFSGPITSKSSFAIEGTLYANDLTITSDIKLKNNVQPLTNCLDNIMNLEGVSYYLNGDNKRKIGFIAQNIEKIYPEFVFDNGNNKSVAYPNVTAVLVEAIKELKNKYDSLEQKYNNLLNNI